MNMPIKPIKQETQKNCTSACLRMILNYYGCHATLSEINGFITKDSEGYSFETEMARFARHKGFQVDCFAYNLYLTDPKDSALTPSALLQKLEQERMHPWFDSWYELKLQSTLRSIREGVKYVIQRPDLRVMLSYLQKGVPLIVTVNPPALYSRQGFPYIGHDIVLSGYEDENVFHFVDPANGAKTNTPCDNLMFALLARGITALSGYMLAINQEH
jgi:hypothetical protein